MNRSALAALSLLLAVAAAAPARADEPDPDLVLAEAKPFREAWELCAAQAAKALAAGPGTPERAARAALGRCKAREARLGRFLSDQLGRPSADRILNAVRASYQDALAEVVRELRRRKPR